MPVSLCVSMTLSVTSEIDIRVWPSSTLRLAPPLVVHGIPYDVSAMFSVDQSERVSGDIPIFSPAKEPFLKSLCSSSRKCLYEWKIVPLKWKTLDRLPLLKIFRLIQIFLCSSIFMIRMFPFFTNSFYYTLCSCIGLCLEVFR